MASDTASRDNWAAADAYERFMGRWSRRIAEQFVAWLRPDPGWTWLEIGCGTGALTSTLCRIAGPAGVVACDQSAPFVEHVKRALPDPRVSALVAGAGDLPGRPGGFDAVVSGLVLNFLSDPGRAVADMRKRTRAGGVVAAYVWDYAGGMEFLRAFWDAAAAIDPSAGPLDEARRFPMNTPATLTSILEAAGLGQVDTAALEIPTRFASFSDYWQPFLAGTGPAPSYVASVDPGKRETLRERLAESLQPGADGAIHLVARAWAVRGTA